MTDVIENLRERAEELLGNDIPEFQAQVLEHIARRDGVPHAPVGGIKWNRIEPGRYASRDGRYLIQRGKRVVNCTKSHPVGAYGRTVICPGDRPHEEYVWRLYYGVTGLQRPTLKALRAAIDNGDHL